MRHRSVLHAFRGAFGVAAAGAALAAAATASSAAPGPATADVLDRAFQVAAEAYPTEPAPGSSSEAIAIRPHATFAEASNPPPSAYARAVQTDLGLAESYFGSQGPRAEADTSIEAQPYEQTIEENGSTLAVAVSLDPSASSSAAGEGADSSSGSSRSYAARVDDALVAEASAEVENVLAGPLFIGQGRFDAHVHIDGTPTGASASGRIVLSETTVDGVPVVVGPGGVEVDGTRVPAEAVEEATAQIQQFFSQGGYSDIRVVQPEVTVAEDGTSAEVSGGGVFVYFTNNDPSNQYFLQYSLLGGRAVAALGADIAEVGPPVTFAPTTTVPVPTTVDAPSVSPTSAPRAVTTTTEPPRPVDDVVEIAYVDGDQTLALRGIWGGWPWVVGGVGALCLAALAALRLEAVRERALAVLDGYLRG